MKNKINQLGWILFDVAVIALPAYSIGQGCGVEKGREQERIEVYKQIDELAKDNLHQFLADDMSDVHRGINTYLQNNPPMSNYYYEGISRELDAQAVQKEKKGDIEMARFLNSLSGEFLGYEKALKKIRSGKE